MSPPVEPVDGPVMRLPGSDQFVLVLGFWILVLALVVGMVLAVRRWRRRRRDPSAGWVTPGLVGAAVFAALGLAMVVANRPIPFRTPTFPPLPELVPESSFFNSAVDGLPAAAESQQWIASQRDAAGAPLDLVPGFYSGVTDGVVYGIPFNVVDDRTPRVDVDIVRFPGSSSPGPYPITDPAYIQSLPAYGIDNHYVAYDPSSNTSWELLAARRWFGRWEADSGAVWDLDDLGYSDGSTTASGLPLLPGLVTYDQVASGSVDHVVLATTPVIRTEGWVWPARKTDGRVPGVGPPPMGSWMRLRADAPVDGLGPQARVVARALQRHGLIVSDTGGRFALRGTPDARWDDRDLATLSTLDANDFEFVDASSLFVAEDTMEARPPVSPAGAVEGG